MEAPKQSVTLSPEQIGELSQKLSGLRHDTNNHLSLILAAVELIRRRPETALRMWNTLAEQPPKISEAIARFTREMEETFHIPPRN
ncbi:MAG: hypothetical protein KGJ60_14820 [Verrucomicrobiota bacterium]|nr:hypothetical protein [Verrucomicrobiota bacterium]